MFKQTNPLPLVHGIDVRKEKQIFFLQNLKNIEEKNRIKD